jgi:CheY-like chemotaxis protein
VEDFMALVSIRDTGMGIPLQEQEAIFDEFRRSERSRERGYGGMGLGLAVSRRLIELHGGKILVRSSGEEEAGSTFYITLPAWEWPLYPEEGETPNSQTVLLLAESEAGAEKLHEHLIQRGFEVQVLAVGPNPDWLAMVMAAPPGAVVLDYQPAAERGWELMRLLKQNSSTREIPVIFYALSAEREQGAVLEMEYLTKPLGSAELAQALDQLGLRVNKPEKTILIVDDEPGILEMHSRMVECELPDCQIIQAHNGREALELIETRLPNLVLLDLMMPEVDGFEVLQTMRRRDQSRNIPVIVLTAQVLTGHDMERLHQGVSAVLGKGLFSLSEVMAQVESALSRTKRLGGEGQRIVRRAIAMINEHYAEPISRASLAQHLAVSENYLTRCFREEMHISPITYLNRFRILRAKALLESGEASITEVAERVGFSDSNYFGRVFRNEVGVSPGAYLHGKRCTG